MVTFGLDAARPLLVVLRFCEREVTQQQLGADVGPWTAAMALGKAIGWADAVPLGDYNLPNTVAWNLAGEERAGDARMLELLAPYDGQRWRVLRLIKMGGSRAPRRGPKTAPVWR